MFRYLSQMAARCVVLAAASFALATSAAAQKKDEGGFQTPVPHAVLIEAESGSVLFEKGADDLVYPASLAKLMTTEFLFNLLQKGDITEDDLVVMTENAWRRGGAPSHTSSMFAPIHSKVKISDILRGIIVQSG